MRSNLSNVKWRSELLPRELVLTVKHALICHATLCVSGSAHGKKTLRIESDPAGARVEIAGESVGTTPLTRENVKDFMFQGPLLGGLNFSQRRYK
jgi:hypothetical protein